MEDVGGLGVSVDERHEGRRGLGVAARLGVAPRVGVRVRGR